MRGRIGDNARISHIVEYIDEIEKAIEDVNFESFCSNHVLRIAVVKWLEIIGEAANNITDETKDKYPGVEWHKMIGLRNIVVHEYFRIDFGIIWDAATVFLLQLKKEIGTIKLD
jgi:uncharacterized protein with HEPN domain